MLISCCVGAVENAACPPRWVSLLFSTLDIAAGVVVVTTAVADGVRLSAAQQSCVQLLLSNCMQPTTQKLWNFSVHRLEFLSLTCRHRSSPEILNKSCLASVETENLQSAKKSHRLQILSQAKATDATARIRPEYQVSTKFSRVAHHVAHASYYYVL